MPIYEYECKNCGKITEQIRNVSQRDRHITCPKCESIACRVLSSMNLSRPATPAGNPNSPGLTVVNNTFENSQTAISLPHGTRLTMKGNRFKNVKTAVEFRKKGV